MAEIPSIISHSEAKRKGLQFYYSGRPCVRGHIAVRYTSNRACIECAKIQSEDWYANPENALKRTEKNRKWREENYEYNLERLKQYREENKEYCKIINAIWRSQNIERYKSGQKEWWKSNSQLNSLYNRSYRSRKRENGGSHTVSDIDDILKMQRLSCAICRCKLGDKYHVDHIVSLSKGGTNDRRNLQILCRSCNQRKWSTDLLTFMRGLGFLL